MIGVVRRAGNDFRFQADAGWSYPLLVSRSFARYPRFLDERQIIEGLYTSEGSLMLFRQLPIGYDVPKPSFVGLRMLLGIE